MPKSPASPVQTLKNGLRLISHPMPEATSVAVLVLVGVGSRYEPADQSGIAHFLEHMFFKGTTNRPTAHDIAAAVDAIGGECNAFTAKEYTGFFLKAAAKDLDLCLDILSDLLFHSTFPEVEITRERGVILEEMNMYLDSPRDRVGEIFENLLYPNQPLGREVVGTAETVSRLSRQELVDFAATWYVPANLVIAVAGQFDPTSLPSAIERLFDQPSAAPSARYLPATINQAAPGLFVQTKPTDQTHLVLGVRAYPTQDPRRYGLSVLNTILGGNMSSRLFTEVREKRGLAYAVQTHIEDYLDTGSLQCQVGLDVKQLPAVLDLVLAQCRQLKDTPVSDQELTLAKSFLRGRLALSLEDPLSQAFFQAKQLLLEEHIQTPDQIINQVDQVSSADLLAIANDIFQPAKLNMAVIGPTDDNQGLAQHLVL